MSYNFVSLVVNSILSLTLGLCLVYFFPWFFLAETGRWRMFVLNLPFIKIIYDFARGTPEKSILFTGIDPFSLPAKHQVLSIGAGFDGWWPYLSTVLSVSALDGKTYNSSIGDYFLIWILRHFGANAPLIIETFILLISLALLLMRAIQYYRFEIKRIADRPHGVKFKIINIGPRKVDVYISKHFFGTPFTGGLFKPYICIPHDAHIKFTKDELDAVVAHELGHIRRYDLIMSVLIQSLGDLFWFLPGYRWLSRKIDRLREIEADSWAVFMNVEPCHLAHALLQLKETPNRPGSSILYSAFFREKSLVKERVERLLGIWPKKSPRYGWKFFSLRLGTTALLTGVLLHSVFGGNFRDEALMKAPDWVDNLFKYLLGT